MRSLALIVFGSMLCPIGASAQILTEHAAAAAGATIGVVAGKPLSNGITKIFGQTDKDTKKAAGVATPKTPKNESTAASDKAAADKAAADKAAADKAAAEKAAAEKPAKPAAHGAGPGGGESGGSGGGGSRGAAQEASRQEPEAAPTAAPAIVEPVVRQPSAEQVANIQVGSTDEELQAALGVPASRVVIPDDDGHLRESWQYWANGRQIGTVRLDNGRVVTVQSRARN
jgi:hypothetical protein